jgi:multidrug efflux pump subunit AcrA (membrane-fusion protein)
MQHGGVSMERKIKKAIVAFFILMLFFTIASRAAASVIVTRVQVEKIKSGRLTYTLSGEGIIKENAEKYIELHNGFRIGEVCVKTGQEVEEGDLLFSYDIEQLNENRKTLDSDLKKLQLQYQKLELPDQESTSSIDKEAVQMNVNSSAEDLKDTEASLEEGRIDIKEKKEEEYEAAVSEWKEAAEAGREAVMKAHRTVSDAESRLTELKKPVSLLEGLIASYQEAVLSVDEEKLQEAALSEDEERIREARDKIFNFYYDGEYQTHLAEVGDAEKELRRAHEDLNNIISKWNLEIEWWEYYMVDTEVRKKILNYDIERKSAERAVEDAQNNLDRLYQRDVLLDNALDSCMGIENTDGLLNTREAYDVLYQLLYESADIDEAVVNTAATELERAREDEAMISNSWDEKLSLALEKMDALSRDIAAIENGSYDYSEALDEYEKAIKKARRSVSEAEHQLTQAEKNEKTVKKDEQTRKKSEELDKQALQLDIDEKQSEIDALQEFIDAQGKVLSPVSGIISDMELEQGIVLSGQEKLVIATGSCGLIMTASKEDIKSFAAGDELIIKTYDNKNINSQIENITVPDQDGIVSFTALLPEGDFIPGGSLNYEITKSSKSYAMCIPIQALRQDLNGIFVLLARSADTVLGEEDKAFRLDVNVVSADTSTAAVEAQLSQEDLIIISSNKNISEGDRIRIDEME